MMCCVIEKRQRKAARPYVTVYKTKQEAVEGLERRCKEIEQGMSNPAGERGSAELVDSVHYATKYVVKPAAHTLFDPVDLWLLPCHDDNGELLNLL